MQVHRLRHVGLADDDRTGGTQEGDDLGVVIVGCIATGDAERRQHAAHGKTFLHAHRHAAERQTGHAVEFEAGGPMPGLHERVEVLVRRPMPKHVVRESLGRSQGARSNAGGDVPRTCRLGAHRTPPLKTGLRPERPCRPAAGSRSPR